MHSIGRSTVLKEMQQYTTRDSNRGIPTHFASGFNPGLEHPNENTDRSRQLTFEWIPMSYVIYQMR